MVYRTGKIRYPQTQLCTAKYCVAYLDILGSKNFIVNDKNNEFLNYLNMLCGDALLEVSSNKDIFIKIFSDNILLAVSTECEIQTRKERIEALINRVGNIQNEILRYGYLVRGAIVEGDFFHNDVIVYGKALIKAVTDEEQTAIYPRVIVQKEIFESLPHYFIMDEDNRVFLNQFIFSNTLEHISFKYQLLEMLNKKPSENIQQKIMWSINYFNKWHKSQMVRTITKLEITDKEISDIMKT